MYCWTVLQCLSCIQTLLRLVIQNSGLSSNQKNVYGFRNVKSVTQGVRRIGAELPVLACPFGFRTEWYLAAKHLIPGCPSFSGWCTVISNSKESINHGVCDISTLVKKLHLCNSILAILFIGNKNIWMRAIWLKSIQKLALTTVANIFWRGLLMLNLSAEWHHFTSWLDMMLKIISIIAIPEAFIQKRVMKHS